MSELTKCWLQQAITGIEAIRDDIPFGLDEDEKKTLAALKIALSVLDAKPDGYIGIRVLSDNKIWNEGSPPAFCVAGSVKPFYTTPPAASVPDVSFDPAKPGAETTVITHYSTPSGWKLVPIEPTQLMIDAHTEGMVSGGATRAYRTMLAAAPASSEHKTMQPLYIAGDGRIRFKENAIVRHLLTSAGKVGVDMNSIAMDDFSDDDRMQFAQLIGYSLDGFGELSYVSDESYNAAVAAAPSPGGD